MSLERFPPAALLRELDAHLPRELSHFDYFKLCLSAHYLSCGTPVPTDVDNQIRQKLWPKEVPLDIALQMASHVLESHDWDFTQVSSRYTFGSGLDEPHSNALSGQLGEWFTVACGAYCALLQYPAPEASQKRAEIFEAIRSEVLHHSEVFGSLWRSGDGLNCLKTSANIAHNLGDLDRVMDMWNLAVGDPLRLEFYKLGVQPFDSNRKLRHLGRLWVAGELYKSPIDGSSMALENHRHYALRKAKPLRTARALLIPTAPFFDDWGDHVAQLLPETEALEVAEILITGWDRQPKTLAYGRALRAIREKSPDFFGSEIVTSALKSLKRTDDWKRAQETSSGKFEEIWSLAAVQQMDEIPSRA